MSSNDQTERNLKNPVVAIAGATGAVGVELMQCLEQRKFPLVELRLLASARSAGKTMKFRGGDIARAGAHRREPRRRGHRAVLRRRRAVEALRSRRGAAGAVVVDNSSLFRMDTNVPLVVPEINAGAMPSTTASSRTRTASPSLPPRRCGRCTRSAGSSASPCPRTRPPRAPAPPRWKSSANPRARILEGRAFTPKVLPHPYAFNVFSHNTKVDPETGYNEEETKVMQETRKIFGEPDLRVTATCVRVPVLRAHCIALNIESEEPLSVAEARAILAAAPGVRLVDDMERNYFPMPHDASGKDEVLVGRIRRDVSDPIGSHARAVRRRRSAAQGRGAERGADRGALLA